MPWCCSNKIITWQTSGKTKSWHYTKVWAYLLLNTKGSETWHLIQVTITFQKPHARYSSYVKSDTFGIRKQKLCLWEIILTTKNIWLPGKINIAHSLCTHWPICFVPKKHGSAEKSLQISQEHKYHIYLNIRWELFPNLSSETW